MTCVICKVQPVGRPLCGTNHCTDTDCVKACPFCLDELRDERWED